MESKIKKCPQMDKNVHLRTGPKWTSRNNINSISNNSNCFTNLSSGEYSGINRRRRNINTSK